MTRADLEAAIPEDWRELHARAWEQFVEWARQNRPALGNVQGLWLGFRAGWLLKGAPLKRRSRS